MTPGSPATERRTTRAPRVMYLQYTNPAAYPPLEHSASILASAGCEVLLVGTGVVNEPLTFRQSDRIRVALMAFEPRGWRQKVHYAQFASWVAGEARHWQPDWVYVSDPLACPAALALRPLVDARFIYHEHDSPVDVGAHSTFMRVVLRARRALAARAELCVFPNAERAELFRQQTGRNRDVITVWNCPMRGEVWTERALPATQTLKVLYHGSIVPARLPRTVLPALASLPDTVSLVIAGYETAGHSGYVESLRREAAALGLADRVTFAGTLRTRDELMRQCRTCDVGMALLPITSEDVNERAMVGASNKVFDYLACGLAVLVGNMPVWRETFAEAGFGRTCDPGSSESISAALRWLLEHPEERVAMGQRGRQRVAADWNYEHQFAPVLARII